METELVTCVICPKGCNISVESEKRGKEKVVLSIKGNSCPRGGKYAESEVTHPVRVLTTTVRVVNAKDKLLPIRSKEPIGKDLLFKAMKEVEKTKVEPPVKMGEVIIKNIAGSGVDMISCRSIE